MAKSRREKTLADWVVIALSPGLIMTLVGSLAFFLLAIAYRGQHEGRVQWVMFWFVLGAVLVARIAIEQDADRAGLLGWTLAGLTALFVYKYIEEDTHVIAWGLLAVIWWCARKLTWDCTLIDESADASGEGLIEAAGFVTDAPGPQPAAGMRPAAGAAPDSISARDARPLWQRWLSRTERRDRPHAPGRWVVYFSLAALPLFGIGQVFIPAAQAVRRTYAFGLLTVYVASALGLLLTTSFLGLRRYLRQRNLQMPAAMTATWIGMGTALALGLLLAALLIPRPDGQYTVTDWIERADQRVREASRFAMLRDGKGTGDGARIGAADPQSRQPGQQSPPPNGPPGEPMAGQPPQGGDPSQQGPEREGGQGAGQRQGANGQPSANSGQPSDPQGGQSQNGQQTANGQGQRGGRGGNAPDGQQGGQQGAQQNQQAGRDPQQGQQQQQAQQPGQPAQAPQTPPPPAPPSASFLTNLFTTLAPFVKWILYGLLAAFVLYQLYRHWDRFFQLLRDLWNELLSLFGYRRHEPVGRAASTQVPETPLVPFSAFNDPFLDGSARRMNRVQLLRYTFEALEAWAREHGCPRTPDQTPLEFAAELARRLPGGARDVTETAQIYARVAYARGNPAPETLDVLERLWRRMNVMANA